MTNMKTPIIWKRLIINNQRMVTTDEIYQLVRALNKNELRSLRYLQEHGYIYRILRGIFYVKNPEEREKKFFQKSIYEMVSDALDIKNVKEWYFALETALKLNNLTHEYFTINYVVTNSYRTTKVIDILDTKFHFLKWSKKHFEIGILNLNGLFVSDPQKTVLDLSYRRFLKDKTDPNILNYLNEYFDRLDKNKMRTYLKHYPSQFKEYMEKHL